jgi:hypothetical protein
VGSTSSLDAWTKRKISTSGNITQISWFPTHSLVIILTELHRLLALYFSPSYGYFTTLSAAGLYGTEWWLSDELPLDHPFWSLLTAQDMMGLDASLYFGHKKVVPLPSRASFLTYVRI